MARSIVGRESSGTPSRLPPHASAAMSARHRARVAMPLAAGISARRHSAEFATRIAAAGCASRAGQRWSSGRSVRRFGRRRRHHLGDARVLAGRQPDVEVGAERARDLLAEERADRPAVDAGARPRRPDARRSRRGSRSRSPAPTTASRRRAPSSSARHSKSASLGSRVRIAASRRVAQEVTDVIVALPCAANSGQ
jgi:hypothetical protein